MLDVKDTEKLKTDLDRLGEWAVEYEMKINPNKSKSSREHGGERSAKLLP
jgi:hypothetical protein